MATTKSKIEPPSVLHVRQGSYTGEYDGAVETFYSTVVDEAGYKKIQEHWAFSMGYNDEDPDKPLPFPHSNFREVVDKRHLDEANEQLKRAHATLDKIYRWDNENSLRFTAQGAATELEQYFEKVGVKFERSQYGR